MSAIRDFLETEIRNDCYFPDDRGPDVVVPWELYPITEIHLIRALDAALEYHLMCRVCDEAAVFPGMSPVAS